VAVRAYGKMSHESKMGVALRVVQEKGGSPKNNKDYVVTVQGARKGRKSTGKRPHLKKSETHK